MKWERRKNTNEPEILAATLPLDYIKMVTDTLTEAIAPGLVEVRKIHPKAQFFADGSIYSDEVLLAITLSQGDQDLFATTVYASADFNPSLDQHSIETVLAACLEGAGSVYHFYLDDVHPSRPHRIIELLRSSLSALEEAPFEWTKAKMGDAINIPVWVKMDKTNPQLEALADQWLAENDPKENPEEAVAFLKERLSAIHSSKANSSFSH